MQALSTAVAKTETSTLPALVDRAANALTGARTSAEILEAKEIASFAYDMAKKAARLQKAKNAHDTLIAATHRAQADALEIEAQAKRRLADEYDAAQERGEVATQHDGRRPAIGVPDGNAKPSAADIGLTRKDIHEARQIRDAEKDEPGFIKNTIQACLDGGKEPSRTTLRKAVRKKKGKRGRPHQIPTPTISQHERDLELINSIWAGICESARAVFLLSVRDEFARAVAQEKDQQAMNGAA